MTLTVLIGNTNTRLTWFAGNRVAARRVFPTGTDRAYRLVRNAPPFSAAAIASVVPTATPGWVSALREQLGEAPLVVGPRTRAGLSFRYRRRDLGADRICAAVGAHARFPQDLVIVDFGTAVTINVVSGQGVFEGGAIMPGLDLLLDALARGTARLPRVAPEPPRQLLGRDTRSAIRAGVFGLLAGGIAGYMSRLDAAGGRPRLLVVTGGRARLFVRQLPRPHIIDPDLAARGLVRLQHINRRSHE